MPALAQALPRPRLALARTALDVGLVLAGSLVIAGLAQLSIQLPFTPVPITGQTLGVLLVGTAYGWLRGSLTLSLYLVQIAMGLPFGAEGKGGLEVLTLATASGGYLWGFILAALLAGWLANRGWDRNFRSAIGIMLFASIVIYLVGIPWLMYSPGFEGFLGQPPTLEQTLQAGLYPFVIGDIVKLLVAASLLPSAWRIIERLEG